MKTVVFTSHAAKQFDALPLREQGLISAALDRYAMEGRGDVRKLQGREGFRMRIGEYRVLFSEDLTTILAVYVGRRQTNTCS